MKGKPAVKSKPAVIRGHVIALNPTNKQATHFAKACGIARLSYNWALAEWQRQYAVDKAYRDNCTACGLEVDDNKLNKPSQGKLRKQLNAIKRTEFPFMLEVSKCAPQLAIMQLGDAYKRFFKGESKYPVFRRKGINDRFNLSNDQFKVKNKKISVPNLGWVKMREALRFNGKILSAKIFNRGGKWFASIAVELADIIPFKVKTGKSVGVDLGITHLATLSNGIKVEAAKPLKAKLARLKRLGRSLSRKQKGSCNRTKAKTKLGRLHLQISNIRQDSLHQLTTTLVRDYDVIAIENLNIKGLLKNRKLSRVISDLGFYEFKRQLVYKANQYGKTVKELDRWFPSSKTCSGCGFIIDKASLTLAVRQWQCPSCRQLNDRDINASINILRHADKVLTVN